MHSGKWHHTDHVGWDAVVVSGSVFRPSGFWISISGLVFGVWGLGFRVLGFGLSVSGFGFRVSGFGFRVSGFEFSVSGFGYWVSCSERRGNSLKAFTDYSQRVKARIWPWLRFVCHIRSTAAPHLPGNTWTSGP